MEDKIKILKNCLISFFTCKYKCNDNKNKKIKNIETNDNINLINTLERYKNIPLKELINNITKTEFFYVRYILPKDTFEKILFDENSYNLNEKHEINNSQFIDSEKNKIKFNEKIFENIVVVIYELMYNIVNKYNIDIIIKVKYYNNDKKIILEESQLINEEIFKLDLPQHEAHEIEESYIIYPDLSIIKYKILDYNNYITGNNCSTNIFLTEDKIINNKNEKDESENNNVINLIDIDTLKKINLDPIGIYNRHLYCFAISVFQVLISIPELNYFFINKEYFNNKNIKNTNGCDSYRLFLEDYKKGNKNKVIAINRNIKQTIDKNFEPDEFHDAQEFLITFLYLMQCELNINQKYKIDENSSLYDCWKIYTKYNNSFIDKIFTGFIRSTVQCKKCNKFSYTYDAFMDLSIPINKKYNNLDSCLENFFSTEKIDSEYHCENCHKKSKILKKLDIVIPPPFLTIHLKRFDDLGRKISSPVKYKHVIDLKKNVKLKFELYGVIIHTGKTMSGGHYICYVKRNDIWYLCDDEKIEERTQTKVCNENAYLLFYKQI